jgi:hypothetical protein
MTYLLNTVYLITKDSDKDLFWPTNSRFPIPHKGLNVNSFEIKYQGDVVAAQVRNLCRYKPGEWEQKVDDLYQEAINNSSK